MLTLVPLMLTLFIASTGAIWAIKRKTAAQAFCVRAGVRMQTELKTALEALLRLNPQATLLRARRLAADRAYQSALASGLPPAIAATKAVRLAVILRQIAFRSRQEALLAHAEVERRRFDLEFRRDVLRRSAGRVESRGSFPRALAVNPVPKTSLTPDYKPVADFTRFQQHLFRFKMDFKPLMDTRQTSECRVSLEEKRKEWRVKILTASAASNWRW